MANLTYQRHQKPSNERTTYAIAFKISNKMNIMPSRKYSAVAKTTTLQQAADLKAICMGQDFKNKMITSQLYLIASHLDSCILLSVHK